MTGWLSLPYFRGRSHPKLILFILIQIPHFPPTFAPTHSLNLRTKKRIATLYATVFIMLLGLLLCLLFPSVACELCTGLSSRLDEPVVATTAELNGVSSKGPWNPQGQTALSQEIDFFCVGFAANVSMHSFESTRSNYRLHPFGTKWELTGHRHLWS